MSRMPMDTESRRIGSRARAIMHYSLDANHWDYREETGNDYGRDCIIELSENNKWMNHKIEGQIKGSRQPNFLKDGLSISFPLDIKTINYALGTQVAFVLFFVDVTNETVYYLPLQDYFITNKKLFAKLDSGQESMAVHIPIDNVLTSEDTDLQQIAKSTYVDGPSKKLKKHIPS